MNRNKNKIIIINENKIYKILINVLPITAATPDVN